MSTVPRGAGDEAELSTLDIVDHHSFGAGYPHQMWARLRAEAPVCPMRVTGWEPFWAVTTPDHIRTVASQPDRFRNAPALHVQPAGGRADDAFRSVINMDPPDHARYRRIVTDQLTRRWVAGWADRVEDHAHRELDATWTDRPGAECDFAQTVAEWFPFRIIAEVMGIPPADHERVLELMNRTLLGGLPDFMAYMRDLALEKRRHPSDDLGSVIAHAEIDGEPLAETELVSYYCSLTSAAHGTVRNTLATGVLALAEHPDQLDALRRRPELVDTAVEEILRWATPIVSFARTAAVDAELAGRHISAGDRLSLIFASANRDEPTFGDPFTFRVDRSPNPHLAFGIGEHYCLGARLARLELAVFLRAFAERVSDLGVVGPVAHYQSSLLSGVEHLPLRYRLDPRPG